MPGSDKISERNSKCAGERAGESIPSGGNDAHNKDVDDGLKDVKERADGNVDDGPSVCSLEKGRQNLPSRLLAWLRSNYSTVLVSVLASVIATVFVSTFLEEHGLSVSFLGEGSGESVYLLQKSGDLPIYPLFSDEVEPGDISYFNRRCATQISITNHDDTAIELTKVKFVAESIEPYLRAELNLLEAYSPELVEGETDNTAVPRDLALGVSNSGWLEATSLTCTISCDDPGFAECFGTNEFSRQLSEIPIGGYGEVPLFGARDVIKAPEKKQEYSLRFSVTSADGKERGDAEMEFAITVTPEGTVDWSAYGMGDGEPVVYGIFLDTSKDSDTIERGVSVVIKGHDIQTIPVCFFPDRSCDVKCRFEFYCDDGTMAAATETVSIHFDVDSRANSAEIYDASKLSSQDLLEIARSIIRGSGTTAISFPYDWYWLSR